MGHRMFYYLNVSIPIVDSELSRKWNLMQLFDYAIDFIALRFDSLLFLDEAINQKLWWRIDSFLDSKLNWWDNLIWKLSALAIIIDDPTQW